MSKYIIEPKKRIPVVMKVDVAVAGGGPAGVCAAVAAARNGADTILIERYGTLYGTGTNSLFTWLPCRELAPNILEEKPLVGGIAQELINTCVDMGGAISPTDAVKYKVLKGFESHAPFDPEVMKVACQRIVLNSGAKLLLHAYIAEVVKKDNEVQGVIIESKSGRQAIMSKVTIDTTGDGDIAAAADAEFEQDPPSKALGGTLSFHLANVNMEKAREVTRKDLAKLKKKAIKNGDLSLQKPAKETIPGGRFEIDFLYVEVPDHLKNKYIRMNEVQTHASLAEVNVLSEDLSRAELTTRRRAVEITNFFIKYVPGFEDAYLAFTPVYMGIKESRRIMGEYVLTEKDIEKGSRFDDVIARGTMYEQDLLPDKPAQRGPAFDIPYRCLVPKKIDSLLVAGRCISINSTAMKALSPRELATCMAVGQAAGTATALCIKCKVKPRELDILLLQRTLKEQGANLGKMK